MHTEAEASLTEPKPRPKRRGCLIVGGIVLILLLSFACKVWLELRASVSQAVESSSAKQVLISLAQYADKEGKSLYPDGRHPEITSANALFRQLFKSDIAIDERMFASRGSIFVADEVIGEAPNFPHAVGPGECHWMVLKQQSWRNHGRTPLIIENANTTAWPPRWKIPSIWQAWEFGLGLKPRGFAWRRGYVIVGRLDGTVELETLRPDGTLDWHSARNLDKDGKSWIDYLTPEQIAKLEYWNVEERK